MFNSSLNLTEFVKNIPSMAIRKHVMLGLCGSINNAVVMNADAVALALIDAGYDMRELEPRDVNTIMKGIELDNRVGEKIGRLMAVRAEWESLLAQSNLSSSMIDNPLRLVKRKFDTTREPLGSLASAIESVCGKQTARVVVNEKKEKLLASEGITYTNEMRLEDAEKRRLKAQFYADQRNDRRGFIEWVLDHVFKTPETEDPFMDLDLETRELYANKLAAKLNQGVTIATQNFIHDKNGLSDMNFADIALLRAKHAELNTLMTALPVKKTKRPKTKLQRVTKDGLVIKAQSDARRAKSGEANDTVYKVKRTRATPTPMEKSLEV